MVTVVNNTSSTLHVSVPYQNKQDNGGFYTLEPNGGQESWDRSNVTIAFIIKSPVVAKSQPKAFVIPAGGTIIINSNDL